MPRSKIFIGDPFIIQFNLTNKCISKCSYCYLKKEKDNNINFQDLKKFLLKFQKWAAIYGFKMHVNLTGGDLWLHPEIGEICDFIYAQDYIKKISLLINSLWFPGSREIITRLRKKIDVVQINTDIVQNSLNDILFFKRENISVAAKIMLSGHNTYNNIDKQVEIIQQLKKIHHQLLVSVDRFCPYTRKDCGYVLENDALIRTIKKIKDKFTFFISDDPLVNTILSRSKEKIIKNTPNFLYACIVPNGGLAVYPNGSIKLCSRLPTHQTGFDIKNFHLLNYLQKFSSIRDTIIEQCSGCKFFYPCGGGCLATSYCKNNKFMKDINCLRNCHK